MNPRKDVPQATALDPTPDTQLKVGKHVFASRLILGTGKYDSFGQMRDALAISGTDCVTVAVRRVDLTEDGASILDFIDRDKYKILPNTAFCFDAETALRTARLSRELLGTDLVKLEVFGDKRMLMPDPVDTLAACEVLAKDGFTVMVYTSDDPGQAVRLANAGAAAIMPAGSPIGSGQGVLNANAIRIIMELVDVPVIVDAGVGSASDVAMAMELGVDGVLLNSGVALAQDPLRMAAAMGAAMVAGRNSFLAGRIPRKLYANASSPEAGVIGVVE